MKRILSIGLGIAAGAAILLLVSCGTSRSGNTQRLNALEADGVLRCQVAGISPARGSFDRAGSAGIGFAGQAPTLVTRGFNLAGAAPAAVMDAYVACAKTHGWQVVRDPVFRNGDLFATGTKTFPGGWTGQLLIAISQQPLAGQPEVDIQLSTDGV